MSTKTPTTGFLPLNIGYDAQRGVVLASDMLYPLTITEVNMSEARKYTEY